MNLSRICIMLAVLLLASTAAFADSLTFTGSTANGEYGPYGLTVNGKSTPGICYSAANWITSGETWNAQAYNINQVGSITGQFAGTAQQYNELGYLANELFASSGHTQTATDLQLAIWSVLGLANPFGTTAGSNQDLLNAQKAVANGYVTTDLFYIPTGPNLPTVNGTTPQPFIVATPEPGTLALMFSGFIALALFAFVRAR
jgi:hypothetical protein